MTILIANIGTSDLAVEIDGYYFPVGFDRNEPNIDLTGLTPDEENIWEQELRNSYIKECLCPELGVTVKKNKFSFRELTEKLLQAYEQDEKKWHPRIRPGRIWGVFREAKEDFQIKIAYLFVTDQPKLILNSGGEEELNKGYASDTINLFRLLKAWFSKEIPDLTLEKKLIPKNIPAIDQDGLLNEYYKFFTTLDKQEQILISVKGGTPQMQTALRVQAVSSGVANQIYLEPQLSIPKLLAGESSQCKRTSYWRYQRVQRYQTAKQLLERWDFDGAREILKQWQEILGELEEAGIQEVQASKDPRINKLYRCSLVMLSNQESEFKKRSVYFC